ncbi:MAG: hypothetical protein BWY45_02558 [Euryarchaeota archaeon ADurb.Bin294]|nr:MAG: hypothetical protein BWY45_02558 [Euryarchaeota archaeon ADurb.Bin294]
MGNIYGTFSYRCNESSDADFIKICITDFKYRGLKPINAIIAAYGMLFRVKMNSSGFIHDAVFNVDWDILSYPWFCGTINPLFKEWFT